MNTVEAISTVDAVKISIKEEEDFQFSHNSTSLFVVFFNVKDGNERRKNKKRVWRLSPRITLSTGHGL